MILLDLFSGIGGFSLAASWVWGDDLDIVAFCEKDQFCRRVLKKHWPNVPIVEDVYDLDRIVAYAESHESKRIRRCGNMEGQEGKAEGEGDQWERMWDTVGNCSEDVVAHANQQCGSKTGSQLEGRRAMVEANKGKPECRSLGGTPGTVDLLTAGFPCQPASCAGKRKGTSDDRWLWTPLLAAIQATRPRWLILENVPGLLSLEAGVVFERCLSDLEAQGYEVQPLLVPACGVGAPHKRERLWIVAKSNALGCGRRQDYQGQQEAGGNGVEVAIAGYSKSERPKEAWQYVGRSEKWTSGADCHASDTSECSMLSGITQPSIWPISGGDRKSPWDEHWYEASARLCRVDDGLYRGMDGTGKLSTEPTIQGKAAGRVHRLRALGNSIVPQVAAQIMTAIKETDQQCVTNAG